MIRQKMIGLVLAAASVAGAVAVGTATAQTGEEDGIDIVEPGEQTGPADDDTDATGAEHEDRGSDRHDEAEAGAEGGERANAEPCSTKIVGGCASLKGAWPSLAVMHLANNPNRGWCGGSVIDPYWILTASHCITSFDSPANKVSQPTALKLTEADPGAFVVREGMYRLDGRGDKGRTIKVAQIVRHPNYQVVQLPGNPQDEIVFLNDFALIRLAKPAKAPRQTLARRQGIGYFTKEGTEATVVGYGDLKDGAQQGSTRMMQVDIPVVSEQKCRTAYTGIDYGIHVCAGLDQGGKDSCQGDSGGPLFARDSLKQSVQMGVVSYGKGCAQPNAWGVYSSVGSAEEWIRSHVPNAVFSEQSGGGGTVAPLPGLEEFVNGGPSGNTQIAQLTVEIAPGNQVKVGEALSVRVTSSVEGRLVVFNRDDKGQIVQLFPNNFSRTTAAGLVSEMIRAGDTVEVPGPDAGFLLRATPPAGANEIIAIVAHPDADISKLMQAGKDLKPIANPAAMISAITTASAEAEGSRGVVVEGTAAATGRAVGLRRYQIVP